MFLHLTSVCMVATYVTITVFWTAWICWFAVRNFEVRPLACRVQC